MQASPQAIHEVYTLLHAEARHACIEGMINRPHDPPPCSPVVLYHSTGLLPHTLDPDRYREVMARKYHHTMGKPIDWTQYRIHYPYPDISAVDGIYALQMIQSAIPCEPRTLISMEWYHIGPCTHDTIHDILQGILHNKHQPIILNIHA